MFSIEFVLSVTRVEEGLHSRIIIIVYEKIKGRASNSSRCLRELRKKGGKKGGKKGPCLELLEMFTRVEEGLHCGATSFGNVREKQLVRIFGLTACATQGLGFRVLV